MSRPRINKGLIASSESYKPKPARRPLQDAFVGESSLLAHKDIRDCFSESTSHDVTVRAYGTKSLVSC